MSIKSIFYNALQKHRRKALKKCGENVRISKNCTLQGNIECGSNITIGVGDYFVSTDATIHIHDNVMFGPNVTIYSGDHVTDMVGMHICDIQDKRKCPRGGDGYDADVVIESGCWIGTRAIILKGVTIGRGSVIGAGAVVTKDVPPYSIYTGVPEVKVRRRFTEAEIQEHERIIGERQ